MVSKLRDGLRSGILALALVLLAVISSHGQSVNYVYDNLNRLIRVDYADGTAIEYTYDGSGNRLTKSILETVPPVTTASPPGGTYSSTQSVTLTCNDGSGSGCDKIYYTADGSTPTTSSPIYSSPINISADTTLKFFAKDLAGNSESVKTEIYTFGDATPPTPNPMTWAMAPYAASPSSISMVATGATDSTSPPVFYYFEFVGSPTGGTGGSASGWQGSTSYTNTVLQPNHQYGYRVKARDSAPTPNETSPSSPAVYIYTPANGPGNASFSNVTQNSIGANWLANGNRSGTEYYCENTTQGTNSGWTTKTYWDSTGLTPGTSYAFRVKARNGDSIETGWTDLGSQGTGPGIRVAFPNGGETWAMGCSQTIRWASSGVSGHVKIEVSRDGGSSWATLISSTPNDGSHSWTVAAPATTQARIRVSSVKDPRISDMSDGDFRIGGGSITVTSPNGGEIWPMGSSETIRWTSTQICGKVKIELSRDGGSSWSTLISSTPNDGAHPWKVAAPATTQARIRVSSVKDPRVSDISDGDFRIGGGAISVTVPNGGEAWTIGTAQSIQWKSSWVGGNVKVELSRNGGRSWKTIITSTPNDGAQNWTVASPATTSAQIRVSNVSDSSVADTSDGNFNIR